MSRRCLGMALSSAAQDKGSAPPGKKQSLVSRLRRKFTLRAPWRGADKSPAAAGGAAPNARHHQRSASAPLPVTLPLPDAARAAHAPAAPAAPPSASPTGAPAGAPATPPNRRSVVPGLPRQATLKRQQSEHRDRLRPYEPRPDERRARSRGSRSPIPGGPTDSLRSLQPIQSQSIASLDSRPDTAAGSRGQRTPQGQSPQSPVPPPQFPGELRSASDSALQLGSAVASASSIGLASTVSVQDSREDLSRSVSRLGGAPALSREVEEELDWRWILNLSMHFRDESNREKFFVTYAQNPGLRRRLTISCDYRDAEEGTLEKELSKLRYQRDKSAKIYESIRDSLQDIIFYDTITNLKLQTSEGRLHVHVTEDLNEIIPYPPVVAISHLRCPKYRESDLEYESHLSGFVYKVRVKGEIYIKKEIPGPDTVDEFLYEINALYHLADSDNVIRFGGCVVDDRRQKVKGLLISFASKGALIDILFNERGSLPWSLREKWAKQIVAGLSEIHEAGYVQGDFTLSNIVIDEHNDAKIIDINRRGCPVGWEPPEVTAMIEGLQRIGMYIGVKSDLFQLGMVLWGIAHEMDEPESVPRPLTMDQAPEDVPAYFRAIVEACLCDHPQERKSAKEILAYFPERVGEVPEHSGEQHRKPGDSTPSLSALNGTPPEAAGERPPDTAPRSSPNGFPPGGGSKPSLLLNGPALQTHAEQTSASKISDFAASGHPVSTSEPASPTSLQVIDAAPSEISSQDDAPVLPNIIGVSLTTATSPNYSTYSGNNGGGGVGLSGLPNLPDLTLRNFPPPGPGAEGDIESTVPSEGTGVPVYHIPPPPFGTGSGLQEKNVFEESLASLVRAATANLSSDSPSDSEASLPRGVREVAAGREALSRLSSRNTRESEEEGDDDEDAVTTPRPNRKKSGSERNVTPLNLDRDDRSRSRSSLHSGRTPEPGGGGMGAGIGGIASGGNISPVSRNSARISALMREGAGVVVGPGAGATTASS